VGALPSVKKLKIAAGWGDQRASPGGGAAGGPLPLRTLVAELAVGAIWAAGGYAFLRWMAARARSTAAYDFL